VVIRFLFLANPVVHFRSILVFALLLACSQGHAQAPRTVAQSAARAMLSFPEVRAAAANSRAVGQTIAQSRGGYFPSIDFNIGTGRETSDNASSRATGRDITLQRREAEITLSQLLFDGGVVAGQVRRSEARARGAERQFAAAVENAASRAAQAHLEARRLLGLVQLAEENVKRHQVTLTQVSALADSGRGRRVDTQQAEARLAFAQASVAQLRGQLAQAEATYRQLVGDAPGSLAEAEDWQPRLPASLEAALERVLDMHPAVRAAEQELQAVHADRDSARARLLAPRVALEAGGSHNNNLDGLRGVNADHYAVVRLRLPLFRGGADDARVRETEERIDEAYFNVGKARNDVERELRQAWDSLREDRARFPQLGRYVAASSEVVSAYQAQFMIGQRTLLDVLNAENELFTAKSSLYTGRYAVAAGEIRVLAAAALLLESLSLAIPADSQLVNPARQ